MPRAISLVALCLALHAGGAVAETRLPLKGVSSIRIANYGAPSVLLEGRDRVGPIVEELNRLRGKSWRAGDTRLQCYSTVIFLSGKKTVGHFRVRPETVVDRQVEKGQSTYSLDVNAADLPRLNKMLAEIPPARTCTPPKE
jgi:hypothetical protein